MKTLLELTLDQWRDMLAKAKRRPCCFDWSWMYSKSLSYPSRIRAVSSFLRRVWLIRRVPFLMNEVIVCELPCLSCWF